MGQEWSDSLRDHFSQRPKAVLKWPQHKGTGKVRNPLISPILTASLWLTTLDQLISYIQRWKMNLRDLGPILKDHMALRDDFIKWYVNTHMKDTIEIMWNPHSISRVLWVSLYVTSTLCELICLSYHPDMYTQIKSIMCIVLKHKK